MVDISEIIEVLNNYGIYPGEIEDDSVGKILEDEDIYITSIDKLFPKETEWGPNILDTEDPRIGDWWEKIEDIIINEREVIIEAEVEPKCAWYKPIHFYGRDWGIYIREDCILNLTKGIAAKSKINLHKTNKNSIAQQLLHSAFYLLFLHEQFHHKVESLGFRLLISTGSDRYRPYKANVYRHYLYTKHCLEESLANAESFRRLSESIYSRDIDDEIKIGRKEFLRSSIPKQRPGYREGVLYLSDYSFQHGLYMLQSQILDGILKPKTNPKGWSVAPHMITALMNIKAKIYVIVPSGSRPIFSQINP